MSQIIKQSSYVMRAIIRSFIKDFRVTLKKIHESHVIKKSDTNPECLMRVRLLKWLLLLKIRVTHQASHRVILPVETLE